MFIGDLQAIYTKSSCFTSIKINKKLDSNELFEVRGQNLDQILSMTVEKCSLLTEKSCSPHSDDVFLLLSRFFLRIHYDQVI